MRLTKRALIIAASLLVLVGSLAAKNTDPRTMKFPPLQTPPLPKVEQVNLPNGMKLMLCEDHRFPIIKVDGIVRTGSIFDPADKVGLATLTGDLIASGGTSQYTADQLDSLMTKNAIDFTSSIDTRMGEFSLNCLIQDRDLAFSIMKDALMHPVFAEDRIQTSKMQMQTGISRRNDQNDDIAFREFKKLLYGANSPYARTEEYATIQAITRDDIVNFYRSFYFPNNITISVVGDFSSSEMKEVLQELFADWSASTQVLPAIPTVPINIKKTVNVVHRDNATQSWILLGHLAEINQTNPDNIPMILMNNILGGEFNSRIFQRVRTQMGLAYSPAGMYITAYDYPGFLVLMSQTKSEKVMTAIDALIDEVRKMQNSDVTDAELNFAKDSYLNSIVFKYSDKDRIVSRMMYARYWGLPLDWDQQVIKGVQATTKEDIRRVAVKYLHPDDLTILTVGDETKFEKPYSSLGEVNFVDITIPTPKKTDVKKPVTAEQQAAGKKLLASVTSAIGKVATIKNVVMEGKIVQPTPMGNMSFDVDFKAIYPNKIYQAFKAPFGEIATVVNAGSGIAKSPQGVQPMSATEANEVQNDLDMSFVGLVRNAANFEVNESARKTYNGKEYRVLNLSLGDKEATLFIDPTTLLPAAQVGIIEEAGGAVYKLYEQLQKVNGVTMPAVTIVKDKDGKELMHLEYKKILFNQTIDEKIFNLE